MIDVGTAITIGSISDILMSLGYVNLPADNWTGITAKGLISADGVAVTVLGLLTITANGIEGSRQKNLSGNVTTSVAARWVGVRLENVPVSYPLVTKNTSFRAKTTAGFTTIPVPEYFTVRGTDSGGLGASVGTAATTGVRTRLSISGAAPSPFTIGTATNVDALKAGNFWIPDFPTSGTGTRTIEVLVDVGSPIVLGSVDDMLLGLGSGVQPPTNWSGVVAKAIVSTDGITPSVLNTLNIVADASNPNQQKHFSGAITGAPSARWIGIRLENVPINYPLILNNFSYRALGGNSSTADFTVPIGDTSTNFGTTTPGSTTTLYGDPGSRFPLGIFVQPAADNYSLEIMTGLLVVERVGSPGSVTVGSAFATPNALGPFAPAQLGQGVTGSSLTIVGPGSTFSGNLLNLQSGSYLSTPAVGLGFVVTNNPTSSQTPLGISLNFVGVIPQQQAVLVSLQSFAEGGIILRGNWATTNVIVYIQRGQLSEQFESISGLSNVAVEDITVQYRDNPTGAGGSITFLRNGLAFGPSQNTSLKPRITAQADIEINALSGNPAAGVSSGTSLQIQKVGVMVDQPIVNYTYLAVSSGQVSATRLQNLYVDATAVSAPQAAKRLTYQPVGGPIQAIDIVVGPLFVPLGTAFRAILEDWSSGVAVPHPNVLVMTKLARQNCKFEDGWLTTAQPSWSECLPQGPVPIINGIAYYCEAVRIGTYTQFQFGYDWSLTAMPSNPFGDPSGKDSYMVPHKWRIEDSAGTVVGLVQRPDGGALNGVDIPRIFAGSFDGRNIAITNSTSKYYPHGTVRSAVVWRSGIPVAYNQAVVSAQLPRFDVTIPYAMHTDFSCNGFDYRIFFGGAGNDGQTNGFGNTRVIPFNPTNYATLTAQVGVTQDPYKASLYSFNSLAAVSSTWMKYTPFNQCGRTPLTGPGGIRDDRVAIAEPVVQYMYNISSLRPHDGIPNATLALDFLTSYASDPFHCFELGRCVPLYKGINANRVITLRNHYYGPGEASTPPERAYYIQSGRPSDFAASINPLRMRIPTFGFATDKPTFGVNAIDSAHAHQYPHWGSLLWQSPEFAFLGHKLWDQNRLYSNVIIAELSATRWATRDGAWQFLHAVMAWKTASANSDRLYNRKEVLDFVSADFEWFSDNHKTATPGFDNPPSTIITNGFVDERLGTYAIAAKFGVSSYYDSSIAAFLQHEFFIGYWVSALGIAESIGFNSALRARSAKAGSVLDWMIARHRQRIIGRINEAPRANLSDNSFIFLLWRGADILNASGAVNALPQTYTNIAARKGNSTTWDVSTDANGLVGSRDGQGLDQLMAGPTILKNQLKLVGSDIDAAISTVTAWRDQKKAEQLALGVNAGESWFKTRNGMNNPAIR